MADGVVVVLVTHPGGSQASAANKDKDGEDQVDTGGNSGEI